MRKKLAILLAAVMIIGTFAACNNTPASSNGGGENATTSENNQQNNTGEMKVDVFYYDYSDVYISSVRSEMDTMLDEMGVEKNNWDAGGSQPAQSDQVNTAITNGSDSQGVAYILLQDQRDGRKYWGVGLSHNINLAPLRAILSAINRSKRK